MKKKFLFGFIALYLSFIGNAFAQFTSSADATNDTLRVYSDTGFIIFDTVTNTSGDSITINWHVNMTSSYIPSGWSVSACDNYQCYTFSGATHTSDFIHAGSTALWYVDITPTSNGTGYVTEVLIDTFGSTTSKTIVSILTASTVGISKVTHVNEDVIIYPNPAKNDVNIITNEALGAKTISIYNLIGKFVGTFKVTGNNTKIDLGNLSPGIYFMRLTDANNNIITTRKLTRS